MDIVFIGITVAFFAISIGYIAACDRLMSGRVGPPNVEEDCPVDRPPVRHEVMP